MIRHLIFIMYCVVYMSTVIYFKDSDFHDSTWFFLGAMFGAIGLIILIVPWKKKKPRVYSFYKNTIWLKSGETEEEFKKRMGDYIDEANNR